MCGIVGYAGMKPALPVLLDGLARLEYRGYDSAGVAWISDDEIERMRCQGKLAGLRDLLEDGKRSDCPIGIGHTRWATHGAPTEENAHPHTDCTESLVVVHNGIIENYYSLREQLKEQGHTFRSETDTEVLAHLIEKHLDDDIVDAVRKTLAEVEGAFAMGVLWKGAPDILVAARKESPLVLGAGEGENFMASDIPALLPYTREIIFLEDGDLAVLKADGIEITRIDTGEAVNREVKTISWDATAAEKAGFRHFMLKEIYEQPQGVLNTFRGRVIPETGEVDLPEIELADDDIKKISRIVLLACGTSWHAGLVAKYWIEEWAGIPVEVDLASEFRYRRLLVDDTVLTVPISQSGETADTLAGLRIAKEKGSPVIAICNVVGSTITRESHGTIYTHAGPEIGVASTKAFTSQLTALYILALYLAQVKGTMSAEERSQKIHALTEVPRLIEKHLEDIQKFVKNHKDDFGRHIIPQSVDEKQVYGYKYNGYWADIGTIRAFYDVNLEITSKNPPFSLIDEGWPIYTHPRYLPGSQIEESRMEDALIAEGCWIQKADISSSIIGLRSQIRRGTKIKRSILATMKKPIKTKEAPIICGTQIFSGKKPTII